MEQVYERLNLTRQAFHKFGGKALRQQQDDHHLVKCAASLRDKHHRMGCRKIANRIKITGYGRDKTERLLLKSGFRIPRKIKHVKTTQRQREMYFPNLIEGLKLKRKNRVIQTDITYYGVGEDHYYIVFILDVYTRLITGYNVSSTLKASENIKALKMALRCRQGQDHSMLIHHSDKGSQYINKEYLELLKSNGIQVSMCDYAWENAYCERLNRTIKEEYLETRNIQTLEQLKIEVKRAVNLYNTDRGHQKLYKQMSPFQFEQFLTTTDTNQHPEMELYSAPDEVINNN